MSKLYNEQAAINHVNKLAFKRHAATEGETKTINYLLQKLEKDKVNTTVESFEWTKTSTKIMKAVFLWIFLFISVCQIISFYPIITWILLPLDGLFILTILLGVRYISDRSRIIYLGKKRESKNVIATIQARDLYPERPVIIFSAHYDSVGSRYPIKMIKFLYIDRKSVV